MSDLMKADGPPGASSNGFNENLALFNSGKCGMWIDATVAGSFVTGKDSTVADKVGFALAPDDGLGKRGNWLWAWSLAIPAASTKTEAAEKFISWATDKAYLDLVASKDGWSNVPPGTRTSLYKNPEYLKAAPFAEHDAGIDRLAPIRSIRRVKPVPYVGVQFVGHSRVRGHRDRRRSGFLGGSGGKHDRDAALAEAQTSTEAAMKKAGYIK